MVSTLEDTLDLARPVLDVARDLLGCHLVASGPEGTVRGRIVETEAYSEDDPASHSYNGPTERSRVMFGPPGHWYIYKCYGIHWMTNVVCGEEGRGEAVLLRAVEPVEGQSLIRDRREVEEPEVTNGPGKLSEAFSVTRQYDGEPVDPEAGLYLRPGTADEPVLKSPRVGIQEATERPWRFFLEGNDYVSKVSENDAAGR